MEVKGK